MIANNIFSRFSYLDSFFLFVFSFVFGLAIIFFSLVMPYLSVFIVFLLPLVFFVLAYKAIIFGVFGVLFFFSNVLISVVGFGLVGLDYDSSIVFSQGLDFLFVFSFFLAWLFLERLRLGSRLYFLFPCLFIFWE